MLESEINFMGSIRWQNSARLYCGFEHNTEVLDEDWEVRDGLNIPMDTYRGWNTFLWLFTNESTDVTGNLFLTFGNYYTGTRFQLNPDVVLYNFDRTRIDLSLTYNHVDLPVGNFNTKTLGCRLYYYFSPKLYLKAYLQYNDDRKANDGNVITLANILLRWIYRPGSDLYLVYNDAREHRFDFHEVSNRTVMLKATYFWRK
jgi:hypothetical protein